MEWLESKIKNPVYALIGSVVAFVISIIGLVFAYQSYELSSLQFKQERLLILKGIFDDKGQRMHVVSAADHVHFLRGEAYFPHAIHKAPVPIDSSGMFWHMGAVVPEIETFIGKKIKPKEGYIQLSDSYIPIIINSYYATKGEAYTDMSLYMLGIRMQLSDEEYSTPKITLTSLSFINHLDNEHPITPAMLDDILNNAKELRIPARSL